MCVWCVYGYHESCSYSLSSFTINVQITLRGFNYGYRMGCKNDEYDSAVVYRAGICGEREKMSQQRLEGGSEGGGAELVSRET